MRVRHPQGVERHVALPVVHPVPVAVEFAVDLAVPCELPCDAFPDPAVEDIQLLRASEHVVEREAAEPLVCIVGRVHSTLVPFLPPQSAVGEGVGLDELGPGAIQRFDQVALQDSPCGGRTWNVGADDANSRKGLALGSGGERTRCEHGKLHGRGSLEQEASPTRHSGNRQSNYHFCNSFSGFRPVASGASPHFATMRMPFVAPSVPYPALQDRSTLNSVGQGRCAPAAEPVLADWAEPLASPV